MPRNSHQPITLKAVATLCGVSIPTLRESWLHFIPESSIDRSGRVPTYRTSAVVSIWRERMRRADSKRVREEDAVSAAESPALEAKRWAEAQIKQMELAKL